MSGVMPIAVMTQLRIRRRSPLQLWNPSGIVISCGNTPYGNLYMDYMDFTDDMGMHLFTYGQRDRMRSLFADGGFRQPLLTSTTGV